MIDRSGGKKSQERGGKDDGSPSSETTETTCKPVDEWRGGYFKFCLSWRWEKKENRLEHSLEDFLAD